MIAKYELAEELFGRALLTAKQDLRRRIRNKVNREIANAGLSGSSYSSQISYEYSEYGLIVTFPDHWMYIEFGTGLRGAEGGQHPDESFLGVFEGHNVGTHSSVYDKYGPVGYFPFPISDGNWSVTSGREASPIVYNTWVFAEQKAIEVYNKHLKGVGF